MTEVRVVTVDDKEDVRRETLIYTTNTELCLRDFVNEARPRLDSEKFVENPVVLINVDGILLDDILDKMFSKAVKRYKIADCSFSDIRSTILIDNKESLPRELIRGFDEQGKNKNFDQTWFSVVCSSPMIRRRCVAIARLKSPANFGELSSQVSFVILVVCSCKEKATKTSQEMGITFSSIFSDIDFRHELLSIKTEEEFVATFDRQMQTIFSADYRRTNTETEKSSCERKIFTFMEGLREDVKRRCKCYISDYVDGVRDLSSFQKLVSTTFFLYFACLLPAIAFGSLNYKNTRGNITVQKVIFGQTFGGIFFALVGGQPLLILLTTAPLALYTKTVYDVSESLGLDFFAVFACVGLWNAFFLLCYSIFDVSKIMKWCTRSTEEIFALFITVAFFTDSFKHVNEDFAKNYFTSSCFNETYSANSTPTSSDAPSEGNPCNQASSILYLFLMFGTLWLGLWLYNFTKTPYLHSKVRELIADYSLPVSVLFVSFAGSYIFRDIKTDRFVYEDVPFLSLAPLRQLTVSAIFVSMGLGFCLSILFFMDQNISASMVNAPSNRLKKGPAYHYDLLVVGILNGILSVFCLPWMHAAIPHCPLHARCLADYEERLENGFVQRVVVRARETRLSALLSHVLIGLSLLLLPYPLAYIPTAVLDGLFLYVAVTGLFGNQLFDRILLLFTEQSAYPPNHYVRRVPQRKVHIFTAIQLLLLAILVFFGFFPVVYLQMAFPLILFVLMPIRHLGIKTIVEERYLQYLDGE